MPHAVHLHLPHDSEGNVESTFAIWAPGYVYSVLATKHSKEFFFPDLSHFLGHFWSVYATEFRWLSRATPVRFLKIIEDIGPADSTGTTCRLSILPTLVGNVSAKLSTGNFLSFANERKSSFRALSAGESGRKRKLNMHFDCINCNYKDW